MVPYGWNRGLRSRPLVFLDRRHRVRESADPEVPTGTPISGAKREEIDEELRLAYVALTRAQSHLVLWWAPTSNTPSAPLHRLLFHDDSTTVAPTSIRVPKDADARSRFDAIAAASNGGLAVETVLVRPAVTWSPPAPSQNALSAAVLGRGLDLGWRRTSYSALTAAAHDGPRLGSEPEVGQKDDEADLDDLPSLDPGTGADDALRLVPSAWDSLGGGTRFGTLVHAILERLENPCTDEEVRAAVATQVLRSGPAVDVDQLTDALLTGSPPHSGGRRRTQPARHREQGSAGRAGLRAAPGRR